MASWPWGRVGWEDRLLQMWVVSVWELCNNGGPVSFFLHEPKRVFAPNS